MFDFLKRIIGRKDTADTFVEAYGGSWIAPETIRTDGGENPDYVMDVLIAAQAQAQKVPVGQQFDFTLKDIPRGISGPHEIIVGIMMHASNYGLQLDITLDETVRFTRIA